ncbi:ATP-binding protein [Bifidobacterium aquikefiricola]|uniref:ATP-binding protein n=1 Tax=Bifidobacterium TaxID=1678 RepID=UPI0034E1E042
MRDDDYATTMSELIELMRIIGNDTQQCEVKESRRKLSSSITDTLSAFSNGSGGYIILGLSEKAGFTPVEGFNARSMQEALSQACEKMTPVVRPIIMTCPFEGSNLVFARIDEMLPRDKPCYTTSLGAYNGSFIRTGDGDRRMTGYEVERLMEEQAQPTYDARIVAEASIDDLNPALVHGCIERQRELHPKVFQGSTDIDILRALRILDVASEPKQDEAEPPSPGQGVSGADLDSDHGGTRVSELTQHQSENLQQALHSIDAGYAMLHPTLAGLLALGRYPQQYFPRLNVTIAVFPGTSRAEVFSGGGHLVTAESITGPIPIIIDDAVESLMSWTSGPQRESNGIEQTPDYPRPVLREAIANAIMHRDYAPVSQGTQVRVDVFTNRIEITNPGGLFGSVTHSTLKNPIMPSTRNQFLVAILESTPYPDGGYVIENGGSGYQQIAATLRSEGMEPAEIDHTIDSFKVTITRRGAYESSAERNIAQRIVQLLEERPSASVRDIMFDLHLSPISVASGLRALLNKGLVESITTQPHPQKQYRLLRESVR